MIYLAILMVGFMVYGLLKTFVGCFTMVSFCHSMRKTNECSMSDWDDLLED